jgi:hypothetical protein
LPGQYNVRQLFWLGAANEWCLKSRPEILKLRILTGLSIPLPRPWTLRQHAPIRIRLQLSPRQCNESSTKMRRLVKHLHFLKTKMLMRHPVYFLKIT